MTELIVVGVDGTASGLDAVALAVRVARVTGAPLLVACVYPEGRRSSLEAAAAAHGPANKALEEARALADEAAPEYRTVPSSSPARGLAQLAEEEDAAMVVVGSHRAGAVGRVVSGGTGERLLHGSGCPVAMAPRGYRRQATDKLRRIGVAFVDTPDGHEALARGADLASRSGLPLTVLSVVGVHPNWLVPEAVRPEQDTVPAEVREDYQEALDRALAGLPEGVQATGELLYGEVVDELSMVGERGVDLLVCGSRGYGPVRRVLLGTVSSALLRQASVPVLVVPRGGDDDHRT
jgi:nucleotide-binding universal stress UspA family protein